MRLELGTRLIAVGLVEDMQTATYVVEIDGQPREVERSVGELVLEAMSEESRDDATVQGVVSPGPARALGRLGPAGAEMPSS